MRIVIDTREQLPYLFDRWPEVETTRAGIPTGDYTIEGHEHQVAIERKELGDLIGCLCSGRDRFKRELERAGDLAFFAVVVEAGMHEVYLGRYRSAINPHAALQSILAFQVRYGIPFIWAGDRSMAEYTAYSLLEKFFRYQTGGGGCRRVGGQV